MDHRIKVWPIDLQQLDCPNPSVIVSENWIFNSATIHHEYVDCVKWYGELLLCKGVSGRIRLIDPRPSLGMIDEIIGDFTYETAPVWFLKFAVDTDSAIFSVGNQAGKVFFFELQQLHKQQHVSPIHSISFPRFGKEEDRHIRDCCFCDRYFIATEQGGKIAVYRWLSSE